MIKLYTTSIRSKILLGFTVILLIMLFATVWSVYNFYRLNESMKVTMLENYSSIIAADNMSKTLDEQLHALIIMFNKDFVTGEKLFKENKEDFFYWYERARSSAYTIQEKNILDTLNIEYQGFTNDLNAVITNRKNLIEKSIGIESSFINIVDEIKDIKRRSNQINQINHELLNKAVDNVKSITQTATAAILIILFGAISISLLFSSKFADYIVKPINNLRKSVKHIADGNFNERIEIDENSDEINGLADEFNKMGEKLQKYEELNISKLFFEKKKSELVIEGMNEPVLLIDENYNVLLSNKSFDEAFSSPVSNHATLGKILKSNPIANQNTKSGSSIFNKEDIITTKDQEGNTKYFMPITASLDMPDSGGSGTVIVFNDVTKYLELDRMKSEFIAKVSHELKTPLTSMGMALGLLEDGVAGKVNSKQNELLISMKEDYERLNKLVYEILELTKLEANREKIKFERFESYRFAEHIGKKFIIQAKEKSIDLQVVDKSLNSVINGSFDHLLSAIENLLSNSIRFTPTKGEIKYIQYLDKDNLIIEISDTGIGISPDNLKKIFDKFIQIDDNSPGSLGLGLSIAKEIIEIHKGEIKAFSELGKGSTFQIKLPVAYE